jgi:hypothetical protein
MIIIIIIIRPRPAPAHKVQTRFAAPVLTAHPLLLCSFCLPAPLCSALPTLRAYAATVPASVRASDRVNVKPHTHSAPYMCRHNYYCDHQLFRISGGDTTATHRMV